MLESELLQASYGKMQLDDPSHVCTANHKGMKCWCTQLIIISALIEDGMKSAQIRYTMLDGLRPGCREITQAHLPRKTFISLYTQAASTAKTKPARSHSNAEASRVKLLNFIGDNPSLGSRELERKSGLSKAAVHGARKSLIEDGYVTALESGQQKMHYRTDKVLLGLDDELTVEDFRIWLPQILNRPLAQQFIIALHAPASKSRFDEIVQTRCNWVGGIHGMPLETFEDFKACYANYLPQTEMTKIVEDMSIDLNNPQDITPKRDDKLDKIVKELEGRLK